MKENDRSASRRATTRRIIQLVFLFVFGVYLCRHSLSYSSSSHQNDLTLLETLPEQDERYIRDILEANLMLVDLFVPREALSKDGPRHYKGVEGIFCRIDWNLQKKDVTKVPFFKHLIQQSGNCAKEDDRLRVDIADIVRRVRAYDDMGSKKVHSLEMSGTVFHQSRCGSTLVSNLLLASNPQEHRVYSEAIPPNHVAQACSDPLDCDTVKATQLLKDVFYLMGRSNNPNEKRVFYKLQAKPVKQIQLWTQAAPEAPWMFVYRDLVEVMMSYSKSKSKYEKCNRRRNNPDQFVRDILKKSGRSAKSLSDEELCAADLTSLCEAALKEHESNVKGTFVNYSSLPAAMWTSIVPDILKIPLNRDQIENMKSIGGVYSKSAPTSKKRWQEGSSEGFLDDSEKKRSKASPKIQNAADTFVSNTYGRLNAFAEETGTI